MRTTYIFLFSICIALNSTECMTPKSHQSRNDKDPNSITTLNFSNDCVPNTTMHFLSIPKEVIATYIIPSLNNVDLLKLRLTCKSFYTIIVPELRNIEIDLTTNFTIDARQLKDPKTVGIINLLEQNNLRIKNISFINTNQSGLSIFCTMLHVNTTLTNLNLRSNYIGIAGAQSIADMLKINTTLTKLDLRGNNIRDAGAQCIAKMLTINKTLTSLNLSLNNIGDARVQFLSESLKGNSTLTSLVLGFNIIGPTGAQYIAESLIINTILTNLDLSCNNIGESGKQLLRNFFVNKNLNLML